MQGKYDAADTLLGVLARAAIRVGTADAREFANKHRERLHAIAVAGKATDAARNTLQDNPDDPDSNLTMGRFYCFVQEDWIEGLPYLTRCSDPVLRDIAIRDWGQPIDPGAQVALADDWQAYSADLPSNERTAVLRQASNWYRIAVAGLHGLQQAKVSKHIQSLGVYNLTSQQMQGTSEFRGKTYLYVETPRLTWAEAEKWCLDRGGHLVCIANRMELEHVARYAADFGANDHYWIGGTDNGDEGNWRWVDGTPFRFTSWYSREPTGGMRENFLLMFVRGFPLVWKDGKETVEAAFMAQWEPK